jgi:D-arabinose 1-dehydrogenase-like Zn-dependent alcohol dehydrogenase
LGKALFQESALQSDSSYPLQEFGKPLAQVLRQVPAPQGSEVLLRVECCGVCHSDVHLADGYFALGGGDKLDLTRSVYPPRVLGHEIVGRVVALGPQAQGTQHSLQVGDECVIYPWIGCGQCALCERGLEQLCGNAQAIGIYRDGGFAQHVLVPQAKYLLPFAPLPKAQVCTYACAGVTAYSALKKVGVLGSAEPLLILGAGGVGLSAIALAQRITGCAPIVAEIDAGKWALARQAGAAQVIDPRDPAALKALLKSTGGVAAAIDFVGAGESFSFGLAALRKAGKLVSVGLFGGSAPVLPVMLAMKAVTVQGSYVGTLEELRELISLAQQQPLPELPLDIRPLAQAGQALQDLKAARVRGRIVLQA